MGLMEVDEMVDLDETEIDFFCYSMDKRNGVEIFREVMDVLVEVIDLYYSQGLTQREVELKISGWLDLLGGEFND